MKYLGLIILGVVLVSASGCSHTVQGVQQDAKDNAPVVQAAAQQAGQSIQQAGTTTDKVVSSKIKVIDHDAKLAFLGTEIKAQIIANKQLNDPHNAINVTSTSTEVDLKGHVVSQEEKAQTDQIAKNVITKDHASVIINDALTINPV